jgi:hypothetical protein
MPTNGAILNFDLCDLENFVKSNTQVLVIHVSLLDIQCRPTYDKNLELIQPLLQELQHFLCFWFWPRGGQAKNLIGPKFISRKALTYRYMCTKLQVNNSSGYETYLLTDARRMPRGHIGSPQVSQKVLLLHTNGWITSKLLS